MSPYSRDDGRAMRHDWHGNDRISPEPIGVGGYAFEDTLTFTNLKCTANMKEIEEARVKNPKFSG